MTEASKTISFLAAGIVSIAAAYMVTSAPSDFDPGDRVGQRLNEFEVGDPKSLTIIKVAEGGSKLEEFEVAEQGGMWTIPSKQGYPADATEQMAAAATGLMNREILRVEAKTADEHAKLGVLNPSDAELDGKAIGVGTRVVMTDVDDKPLVDMIIGDEVKDFPGQYYVRNSNQDVVYVVSLDPDKLTTTFDDWIEDDLLKLDPFNIKEVTINDYSAELTYSITPDGRLAPQVLWDRRGKMELAYDNDAAKWEPLELVKFSRQTGEPEPFTLTDDEELNEEKLREMRNGLDDLLIVDVERKPAGLSSDLKAGEDFLRDRDSAESLVKRGFAPLRIEEGGPLEILSSEGEVICTMNNGVEYVLRFGKLAMDAAADAAEGDAADANGGKLNRFLFVSARFNEDAIERPVLAPLPELPAGADEPADANGAEESADAPDESADADDAQETPAAEEATEDEEEEEEVADDESVATETAAADDPNTDGDAEVSQESPAEADAAMAEEATEDAVEAADEATEDVAEAAEASDLEAGLEALIAERKAIQQENDRLLDQYKNTLAEGRETVAELNERFGDWYYVISEDVYKQIHLSLDDVIKQKDAEPAGEGGAAAAPADDDPLTGLPNISLGGGDEAGQDESAE
ncbi:MAG: DUF4340 domain-containing protein [Planctomycetales bacterium]|nr:DUF4340 domain-containing protein [Planctomycetales bacterium]